MKAQALSFLVGEPVSDWHGCPQPVGIVLTGKECRLEPVDPARHADALFAAYSQAGNDRDWLYLSVGPFPDAVAYRAYAEQMARETDPLHFAVVDLRTGLPVGTLALMRQQPRHGVVEVGFVTFSPVLQRSRIATEAQFLLMSYGHLDHLPILRRVGRERADVPLPPTMRTDFCLFVNQFAR